MPYFNYKNDFDLILFAEVQNRMASLEHSFSKTEKSPQKRNMVQRAY